MMKDDVTYNHADNKVMVRTDGDLIYVICNKEEQQKKVIKKMCTDTCILEHYEEWDEGRDKKFIVTFQNAEVTDLNQENKMTSAELYESLNNLWEEFQENHRKFVDKGNKSAGTRARKAIGEVKKLVTEYRKASVEESKS